MYEEVRPVEIRKAYQKGWETVRIVSIMQIFFSFSIAIKNHLIVMTMKAYLQDLATRALFGRENATSAVSLYSIVDKDMSGNEVKFSSFQGDVLLFVNFASK